MESALDKSQACVGFLEAHLKYRAAIRAQGKLAHTALLTAHQLAFSAVVSYQQRIQGKQYKSNNQSINNRMALLAQFMQGIEITETAISEGLYAVAANLLKQELEIIAAIDETAAGRRKDGKTPSFLDRLKSFGRRYGEFNEVAHPTRKEIVISLTQFDDGEKTGPTTIPQFNEQLYRIFYGNQVMFLVMMLARMRALFQEALKIDWDEDEQRLARSALQILIDEGICTIPPSSVSSCARRRCPG